jgi:hypothetical protein
MENSSINSEVHPLPQPRPSSLALDTPRLASKSKPIPIALLSSFCFAPTAYMGRTSTTFTGALALALRVARGEISNPFAYGEMYAKRFGRRRQKKEDSTTMMTTTRTATPIPIPIPAFARMLSPPADGRVAAERPLVVNGTTPPDRGVAPLKAGAWLVAVESGTAVVLFGFNTLRK